MGRMLDNLGIHAPMSRLPKLSRHSVRASRFPAVMDFGEYIGYGADQKPDFWLGPNTGAGFRESHIAFEAPDRAAVRAFFDAAVQAGAEVLHEPRVWPEYHPGYYGAFVRDPDGNNVEAVCHTPE